MTEPDSIVFEHLQHIRSTLDSMALDIHDLKLARPHREATNRLKGGSLIGRLCLANGSGCMRHSRVPSYSHLEKLQPKSISSAHRAVPLAITLALLT
jgi:hypothetical protein